MLRNRVRKKLLVAFIGMMIILFLAGCRYEIAVTAAPVPNDVGEKADIKVPLKKHIRRNDKRATLRLCFLEERDRDFTSWLLSRGDEACFLFSSDMNKETQELPEGVVYNKDNNRLTLTDYKGRDSVLFAEDMGTEFYLELHGSSELKAIVVQRGSLRIKGDGELIIRNNMQNTYSLTIEQDDYEGFLIIEPGVRLDIGGIGRHQIYIQSKLRYSFYYIAPIKMSDGKSRKTRYIDTEGGRTAYLTFVGEKDSEGPGRMEEWDYVVIE